MSQKEHVLESTLLDGLRHSQETHCVYISSFLQNSSLKNIDVRFSTVMLTYTVELSFRDQGCDSS